MAVLMIAGNVLRFPESWFSAANHYPLLRFGIRQQTGPDNANCQALFAAGLVFVYDNLKVPRGNN
jgi:ABC-type phosphate transport system permease subunit